MNVLVCIKRVVAPGAMIPLTEDGTEVDTRHLGFTVSPHDECGLEEAVRIVEREGGTSTVITVGPQAAVEQLRFGISMGIDRAVLVEADEGEWDPQRTAEALTDAIRALEGEGDPFDLIMFGNESPDAGNYQVGPRVAHALDLPIVSGIKGIDLGDGTASLRRETASGIEVYEVPLPAAAAVKEGLNLPRYPALRGRIRAKQTDVHVVPARAEPGGLTTVRFRHPPQDDTETVILGEGPEAAGAVVDVFEEVGLL